MKKIDFKAIALSCVAMALLFSTSSVFANEEHNNDAAILLASGSEEEVILLAGGCGGGNGHGCGNRANPSKGNSTYYYDNGTQQVVPVNPNDPQNPVPYNGTNPNGNVNKGTSGHGCANLVNNQGDLIEEARRASLI